MINVTITNDNVFELIESFGVSLSLPDSASPRVTLAANSAQITILDDDSQFLLASFSGLFPNSIVKLLNSLEDKAYIIDTEAKGSMVFSIPMALSCDVMTRGTCY